MAFAIICVCTEGKKCFVLIQLSVEWYDINIAASIGVWNMTTEGTIDVHDAHEEFVQSMSS